MQRIIAKLIGQYINLLALIAPGYAAQFGLALFCHPFRGKITERQKQFLRSARQFTFAHNNETIVGYSWGNGEKKALLIHGWQSHSYRWKAYVERLVEKGYTVFAFDAPGHGLSTGKFLSVPVYGDVIEKMILRIGTVDAIVGHSLGGFSTLYTLHRNPSLACSRLVVMASPGEAQEFFEFFGTLASLSKRSMNLIIKEFIERFNHGPEYFSASQFASTLTLPGLVIHDEDDDETSVNHSRRIHQQWRNSRLIVTKGLGHNLKSAEIIKEVVSFFEDAPQQPELPFSFISTHTAQTVS